jgi:hypothetical protein
MASKLVNLRTLNNDFARAYKYEFTMDTTENASVKALLPAGFETLLSSSCLACTLPSVGSQMIEVNVGVNQMKLPGKKEQGGTITPEFLLTGDFAIYKFFRSWAALATPDTFPGAEINGLSTKFTLFLPITVKAFDVTNAQKLGVKLWNCWCRMAPEIAFSDESNDIVRWSPEIVYEYSEQLKLA